LKGMELFMQAWTVAKARDNFTELYRNVTDNWNEFLVAHGSRKNPKQMSLVPTDFLDALLDKYFKFTVEWTYTDDDTAPEGWWTAWTPQLNLYGDGPTREAALHSLAEAVIDEVSYAFRDLRGYFGSQEHFVEKFPYFRRVARLQDEDGHFRIDKVIALLTESQKNKTHE